MIYLGLDPGYSGALAIIENDDVYVKLWPEAEDSVWSLVSYWGKLAGNAVAVIEEVHSFPHDGVASSFKFGRHYGMLRAFLVAAQVPFVAIPPRKWQEGYGLFRHKGETKGKFKTRGKDIASNLYPNVKLTQKTADALLIADYCKTHASRLFSSQRSEVIQPSDK